MPVMSVPLKPLREYLRTNDIDVDLIGFGISVSICPPVHRSDDNTHCLPQENILQY